MCSGQETDAAQSLNTFDSCVLCSTPRNILLWMDLDQPLLRRPEDSQQNM